jgi:hypothetical protein
VILSKSGSALTVSDAVNRHACSSPTKLKPAAAKLQHAAFTSCFSMMKTVTAANTMEQ